MKNGIIYIYNSYNSELSDEEKELNNHSIEYYLKELTEFSNTKGMAGLDKLDRQFPCVREGFSDGKKRKLKNWIKGRNTPYRSSLIELCFDYGLNKLDDINELLYSFNYDALHVRDIRELCYYYALINSIPYDEAKEKADEQEILFKKKYGKESGESRREATGLYTRAILEDIRAVKKWEDLEDYIEDNSSKLGDIKVTAYRKFKIFINSLSDADTEDHFYNDDTPLPYQKLMENVRKSMGMPEKNKEPRLNKILHRTESVSRGVFMLYCMKLLFEKTVKRFEPINKEVFITDMNEELEKCSFAQIDSERCLWDKIVCDCIDASLTDRLYDDDKGATPYELACAFLDYIQDPEILPAK